ncbi:MAG: hypothetical protein ABIG03_00760 [Candidatus Eisenbacteria bacterium]
MARTIVLLAFLLAASSPSSAQLCEEEVTLATSPGAIEMIHDEAMFNCCARLEIEVEQSPSLIEFTEWETFDEGPCYCVCCFHADAFVGGLEPGEYTVKVWKALDNFDGTWTFELAAEEVVLVEGDSDPSLATSFEACVESDVNDGGTEMTWGVLKALYH